ncbi:histidine kinase [Blastococcus sp. CT_GayMR20]|uniref:histidine kinase n=1 Tax=Blastococcus sp. CT_GayMR20 TaxID=2559609 RepID=UPI001ADDE5B6|nr:histidine kinase [Blastococcus sp. CT_GayMR20]
MIPDGIADVTPWRDWSSAADAGVRFLHGYLGWDVWLVTRIEGNRWIILRAHPSSVVELGTELAWDSSFCRQMHEGNAPRVATVTAAVPAYAGRVTGPLRGIAAYAGVPVLGTDGGLFGTVCGLASRAQPRSAARDLPVVEMVARMLSTLLAAGLEPPPVPEPAPRPAGALLKDRRPPGEHPAM